MNQWNTQSEIVRSLRDALDKSVEMANVMHLSELELQLLLDERWQGRNSGDNQTSTANGIDDMYFNGLAGP